MKIVLEVKLRVDCGREGRLGIVVRRLVLLFSGEIEN